MALADDLLRALRQGGQDGLRHAAEQVLEEAKRNAPVGAPEEDPDPAVTLADSGHIERTATGWRVEFTAPYSAKQHEDMRLKHPRGGGPKFLESAVKGHIPQLERIVATRVQKRMGGARRT